mgnify:CR=1 FL=1
MTRASRGFTLLELMLALGLGAMVLAGLLLLTQALTQSIRQQQAVAGLQSTARLALDTLAGEIESAGANDAPWSSPVNIAVAGSVARLSDATDRLVLQRHSPRNCVGNDNPIRRPDGQPAFWLLRSEFEVRDRTRLVRTCYYGPAPGPGTRQLNAATLVEGVELLQLRFGEDRDGDGRVDSWVRAGHWTAEADVLGVRIGLLLAARQPVGAAPLAPVNLLGEAIHPPADGRPRLALVRTVPIRSRRR